MNSVIILRGLPGSGKSTWAVAKTRELERNHNVIVFSADDYFYRRDGYVFDPAKLPTAHAQCLRQLVQAMQDNNRATMIVDNTNIHVAEIAPYYQLALAYWAKVKIVQFECSVGAAVARNVHGVPEATIRSMGEQMVKEEWRFPPSWVVARA